MTLTLTLTLTLTRKDASPPSPIKPPSATASPPPSVPLLPGGTACCRSTATTTPSSVSRSRLARSTARWRGAALVLLSTTVEAAHRHTPSAPAMAESVATHSWEGW